MRHRIFIAINLPENIKNELITFQKKWSELPCRWTKKENLHLTLVFLGYLSDEELLRVVKTTKEVTGRHRGFLMKLIKITYGPLKKMPPRMVWVEGEKNKDLESLKKDLENSLSLFPVNGLTKKDQNYSPHITLGRIRQWEFRKIEPEERPMVLEEIFLSFNVHSIEIMESKLKPQGPDYFLVESFSLEEK